MKALNQMEVITIAIDEVRKGLSAFNVKTNMSEDQIVMFIEDFFDDYSHESVADLKICLKNARRGIYGTHYQSIDGLRIMNWFKQYLVEKSDVRMQKHIELKEKKLGAIELLPPEIMKDVKENLVKPRVKENDSAHTEETVESQFDHIREFASDLDVDQLTNLVEGCKSHNKNGIYDEMIEFINREIETR